jgi:hypothetical protein
MEGYKLQAKFGNAEFNAEGPEEAVREDFRRFLEKLPAAVQPSPEKKQDAKNGQEPTILTTVDQMLLGQALLEKVFQRQDDIVSLRLLPPPESANRNADAAILLLYGFRCLLNQEEVPVTRLTRALRRSGISFERLDQFMGANSQLILRGGARNAARYRLNNLGVTQAETWIRTWFK